MENNQKVLEAFKTAGKALKAGEVADLTGIDKGDVSKIIKKLTVEGQLYSPKVCYYDIKK